MNCSTPKVLNRRHGSKQVLSPFATSKVIYVGRPSAYGNYGSKAQGAIEHIASHDQRMLALTNFLTSLEEMQVARLQMLLEELQGSDLECWCAPAPCHADIWLALANSLPAPNWMNPDMQARLQALRDKLSCAQLP